MCDNGWTDKRGNDLSPAVTKQIIRSAQIIQHGGIVAYPTDTVYGLGASIYNDEAIRKVFSIKSRPPDMPLPVLIADRRDVGLLTSWQSEEAIKLMDRFWPGGLTLIFWRLSSLHSLVLAGGEKIGIRLPGHILTRELIQKAGQPITGTSANMHNKPATLTAAEVKDQLGNSIDLIIDGGTCPGGIESTIIDVTIDPPVVIRQGIIPLETINSVIRTGRN